MVCPEAVFARARIRLSDSVSTANMNLLKNIFCELCPAFVKHTYFAENIVWSYESVVRVRDGYVILSDVLPMAAAVMAIQEAETCLPKSPDGYQPRLLVILALTRVYSGILQRDKLDDFDHWIRGTFQVSLPSDWVGMNVSDAFWNVFQRPSLYSLRMVNGELQPLDFSLLDADPFYVPTADKELPFFPDEVSVCHAQMLPALHACEILLAARQHFVVFGPMDAGKTSFLNILLSNKENIIPANQALSIEMVLAFIEGHTPFVSKSVAVPVPSKSYVLVFDGLEGDQIQVVQFLRMLVTQNAIPFQRMMQKYLNLHECMPLLW
jgi:hypothetical protein